MSIKKWHTTYTKSDILFYQGLPFGHQGLISAVSQSLKSYSSYCGISGFRPIITSQRTDRRKNRAEVQNLEIVSEMSPRSCQTNLLSVSTPEKLSGKSILFVAKKVRRSSI